MGFFSLLWFLVRVIPKPSRAAYPCQRAAFPMASSFVVWLAALLGASFAWRKFLKRDARVWQACLWCAAALALGAMMVASLPVARSWAENPPHSVKGVAKGIFPGRVVWVHAPEATSWAGYTSSEHWFETNHTDLAVVETMMRKAIRSVGGGTNDAASWDAIFRHFNVNQGRGDRGYQAGERIAIKINLAACWSGGTAPQNYVDIYGTYEKQNIVDSHWMNTIDNSPQMMLSLLRHLVNTAGVNQTNIYLGDPTGNFPKFMWDKLHPEFPNVHYFDNYGGQGRMRTEFSTVPFTWSTNASWSTNGAGKLQDYVPVPFAVADYIIDFAVLKGHSTGVTACGKNWYGALLRLPNTWYRDANGTNQAGYMNYAHMHYSTPRPKSGGYPGLGKYRAIVDLMGHPELGGKTLLYLVDGLFGGYYSDSRPVKWNSAPFNNDWPSSLFVSQDPVAIDSVCYDFLLNEWPKIVYFGTQTPGVGDDLEGGAEDYLHEAAEADNPASGTFYDPGRTGTRLASLGVHEHWNNPTDKKYSRNLGAGDGIELVALTAADNPPVITQQPSAQSVCPGANVSFTVAATGDGTLTYQWQTNGVNISDNNHYGGCTETTLTVTNVAPTDAVGVNYRCVVSNAVGSTNSSQAALILKAATTITQDPSGTNACPGANITFTVAATGDGTLAYQWQTNGANLVNNNHYSGATAVTLTVSNVGSADAVNYRCLVTGGCGGLFSSTAALTLKAATTIAQHPASQHISPGSNATFSITAAGDGTLTYQWQKNGTGLSDGGHYSGATTNLLTITGADTNDVATYACLVAGGCGSLTSAPAALSLANGDLLNFSVNRAIPDGGLVGISDTRTVTSSIQSVSDLKVRLKISGMFNGDLFCYLSHGSGYSVLLNRPGRRTADVFGYDDPGLDVMFDDAAVNDAHVYRLTVTGNHNSPLGTNVMGSWVADGRTNRPDRVWDTDARPALLDSFTGLDPNGSWTIFVADLCGGDSHTLVSWGLEITGPEATATTGTIYGQVQLQGFNPTQVSGRTVHFVASDTGGIPLQTNDVNLTFAGSPMLADYQWSVPTNTAFVSAKTAWNLRRRQAVTFTGGAATNNFTGTSGQLLGGDISQNNNLVNTADYTVLKGNWLKSTEAADITGDGLVNTADYTILKGNWLKSGDPP